MIVDWESEELKHAFISVEQKTLLCFQEILARLYPDYKDVTPANILDLIKDNQFVDNARVKVAQRRKQDEINSCDADFIDGLDAF